MRFAHLALLASMLLLSTVRGRPVLQPFSADFDKPTYVAQPPGESRMLWVLEKPGRIRLLDSQTGKSPDEALLDISNQIKIRMNEQGLLGLAFDPGFEQNKRFYLYFTGTDGNSHLARYTLNQSPDKTRASEEMLLEFPQDFKNHNGGFLDIGPDGCLYLGTGDGGAGNDPKNRAQDLGTYLGKLLRIDIRTDKGYKIPPDNPFKDQPGAKPEIYSYGLRNPWRCSFDAKTKSIWIADVGQNHWEEINGLRLEDANGANFGWRLREGTVATPRKKIGGPPPAKAIEPVYAYKHGSASNQGLSVTGGYVYRGKIRSLRGQYLFADYVHPHIWTLSVDDGKFRFKDITGKLKSTGRPIRQIASFGRDNANELYLVDHSGKIYQLVGK